MSNEISIFKAAGAVSTSGRRELTALGKSLAAEHTIRRIQTSNTGTFRRLVNGEQIGKAVRGDIDVIIVAALQKVSRVYYKATYDPDAKPTLPDCWSNNGIRPEPEGKNVQAETCASCPQDIKGSGEGGRRACRFQRRLAVLLAGDPNPGDVYQFNVPAKSIFGKGEGNVHPFESYVRYLGANNESPDTVITNISYNSEATQMELLFTPMRGLTEEEYELVAQAQADPATAKLTMLNVAQADGVTAQPAKSDTIFADKRPVAPLASNDEDEDEDEPEPVKAAAVAPEQPKRRGRPPGSTNKPKVAATIPDLIAKWDDKDDEPE